MPSASDPRQPNRQGQPTPRPVSSGQLRCNRRSVRLSLLLVPHSPPLVQHNLLSVLPNSPLPAQPGPQAVPALSSRRPRSVRRRLNRIRVHIMLTAHMA